MRITGIPFSTPLVPKVMDDSKDVTRRLMRDPPPPPNPEQPFSLAPAVSRAIKFYSLNDYERLPKEPGLFDVSGSVGYVRDRCAKTEWMSPYGSAGDRLYVKEQLEPSSMRGAAITGTPIALYSADHRAVLPSAPPGGHRRADGLSSWYPWRARVITPRYCPRWASRTTLEVLSVRPEHLGDITEAEAIREGTASVADFRALWTKINGAWTPDAWVWRVEYRRLAATASAVVEKTYPHAQLRRSPKLRERLAGRQARIWSAEHGTWWRPNGGGYTGTKDSAGVYEFSDAWSRVRSCGPEKMISLEILTQSAAAAKQVA